MASLIPCLVTLSSPGGGGGGGGHKTFNAFNLIGWKSTMLPCNHIFDRCVFQNLNFPVFDETEYCQFHIFRFLVKNNFVAVTSTFINNCTISVFEKVIYKKSPV